MWIWVERSQRTNRTLPAKCTNIRTTPAIEKDYCEKACCEPLGNTLNHLSSKWRALFADWLENSCFHHQLPNIRRFIAALGVSGMLLLGGLKPGTLTNSLAITVFTLLLLAAICVLFELKAIPSRFKLWQPNRSIRVGRKRQVILALAVSGIIPAIAIQTWFQANTGLAGGDIAPPNGTAWIAHLFSPWIWSGSNLGGPADLEIYLPWATLLHIVHSLGGSAGLAQRIWLTTLFASAGLLALAAILALGLRPLSSAFGSLCYLFNAYFVSSIGFSALYIAALMLLPGVIALVLWVARGRLSMTLGIAILVLSAPLFGYTAMNAPLLGVSVFGIIVSVPLAGYLGGREAISRAMRLVIFGVPLLILASIYWIIPLHIQTSVANIGQISSISSWAWTEGRETLRNGFWLNDTWGWIYSVYYPFAHNYYKFPLNVLRFALPASAFAALTLRTPNNLKPTDSDLISSLKVGSVVSITALFVVLISTGTNAPGALIFKALYSLPYGWLLQGPGRFLYVAGFCYAILVAITADWCWERFRTKRIVKLTTGKYFWSYSPVHYAAVVVAFLVIAAPAYPVFTGAIAPNYRGQGFPSVHVRVPSYWTSMASYLNTRDSPGNLLLLPSSNFYQMQYSWGYYGTDGFVSDMISRNVLDVAPATYFSVNQELYSAVDLLSKSLIAHQWIMATRLLQAIGTSQILVRGDLLFNATSGSGATISPIALATSLAHDPFVHLISRQGPLYLYGLNISMNPTASSSIYTVNSSEPWLQVLSLLPPGSELITAPTTPNLPSLIQVSHLSLNHNGNSVSASVLAPNDGEIEVSEINGVTAKRFQSVLKSEPITMGSLKIKVKSKGGKETIVASEPLGGELLSNGTFRDGVWNTPVGDCNYHGVKARSLLHQQVLSGKGPFGTPALRLSAGADSACESRLLNWHSGAFVVSLWLRHVIGTQPRICFWEFGPSRCSQIKPLPTGSGWQHYVSRVSPDPGTSAIGLVLYADAAASERVTINEYANLTVRSIATNPAHLVFLFKSRPNAIGRKSRLIVADSTWSPEWQGAPTAKHVLVDGIRNGWESSRGLSVGYFRPRYAPKLLLVVSDWLSLIVALIVLSVAAIGTFRFRKNRPDVRR